MSLWPLKIIVKLFLSWVPGRHVILRRFGIFKHGTMDDVAYAHKIFTGHGGDAFPDGLPENFVALELGPGDSVLSALVAKSYGAKEIWLADAGDFASTDIKLYKAAAQDLRDKYNLDPPDLSDIKTRADFLERCSAHYITNGLEGLRQVPEDSVDFIWSHSVLEHIRKRDFAPTMKELRRIVKKDGVVSHNVDLQDHLNKALNNLRFPEKIWEHEIVANAGFYTNRIGYTQSLEHMRRAGFEIKSTQTGQWETLPTAKEKMWGPFRDIPDDELRVRTYYTILKAA